MKNTLLLLLLLLSLVSFGQKTNKPKGFTIGSYAFPTMTREIYGSYANTAMFVRKFRPTVSTGIMIRKELTEDKWHLISGLIFQHYGLNEKYFEIYPTIKKPTYRLIKTHYISLPLGVAYQKNNFYFSLSLSNSIFLYKQVYINKQLTDKKIDPKEKWLIGFNTKIGYAFKLSKRSSISIELLAEINSQAHYFPTIPKYGFEFGYYTYGIGIGYNIKLS